ncbi:unnamed protein product [Ambrosiozyma monospora]|uniref:Unnamed protein product n=1 Tax=Ambrosiozyma monospora TaxID=43982 RepID=A0A9W7DHR3_AMBMO|nr:unnamed protein product [Ambrosiozyma monospora]
MIHALGIQDDSVAMGDGGRRLDKRLRVMVSLLLTFHGMIRSEGSVDMCLNQMRLDEVDEALCPYGLKEKLKVLEIDRDVKTVGDMDTIPTYFIRTSDDYRLCPLFSLATYIFIKFQVQRELPNFADSEQWHQAEIISNCSSDSSKPIQI